MEPKHSVHPSRLYNIDFLRIVFTLCIFFCHAGGRLNIVSYASFSVEFFFILSGFFLTFTIEHQINLQNFVLKKIIRFLPLLLFGQFVCNLITRTFSTPKILSLIFFLPSTGLSKNNHCSVGTAWYVCVLLWISVFYFYTIKTQKKATTNVITGIIIFSGCIIYNMLPQRPLQHLFPESMLRGFICMGLGYFLALIYQSEFFRKFQLSNSSVRYFIFISILEFWLVTYLSALMFVPEEFKTDYIHIVILFLLLAYLFLQKRGFISTFFDDSSWSKISKYCLSFFLTHQIITDYLYYKWHFFANLSVPISFTVMLGLSIVLAVFAYHCVEQPAYKYLKRLTEDKSSE